MSRGAEAVDNLSYLGFALKYCYLPKLAVQYTPLLYSTLNGN